MITRFSSLSPGFVDMEDIGFEGASVNGRLYSNEKLVTVFDHVTSLAQVMERAGFDALLLAEHHFQREGYECIPNVPMLAVHLAHMTERIKIACGFNITPMWHPLRLAEDFATADILTGGRLIFGVGRGYHSREVETFGAPLLDRDANIDLFEEQVDIIFKAFNEQSFSHHGKHYDIPPRVPYRGYELEEVTLVPRPVNLPVECWQPIVSGGQRGLDFMVKHGIKGVMDGGVAPAGASGSQGAGIDTMAVWRDTLARHGRETELGGDLIIGFHFHIADTEKRAIEEARKFHQETLKMFGPLGVIPGLSDEQVGALGDPRRAPLAGLPTIEDAVKAGSWMCGPPELIIEKLMGIQDQLPGLEQMNPWHVFGTPHRVILEQLEWFGKEVLPVFKAQAKTPVGG